MWEGKQFWPYVKHCPGSCLEELKETTEKPQSGLQDELESGASWIWIRNPEHLTMAFLSSDVFLSFQGNKIQQNFLRVTAMSGGSNKQHFRDQLWLHHQCPELTHHPFCPAFMLTQAWCCSRSWAIEVCRWTAKIAVLGIYSAWMNPGSVWAQALILEM